MVANSSRVCIYAHFDAAGTVDPHVRFALLQLSWICGEIVFVTTSGASEAELAALNLPVSKIISRPNVGFDFYSWKVGLSALRLDAFDELILCNDSVYGPLYSLSDLFARMSLRPCDFWGITSGTQYDYHLQSYFLVFRRRVLQSATFRDFWQAVQPLASKQEVILAYEVRFTRRLMEARFKPLASFASKRRDYLKRSLWHLSDKQTARGFGKALQIYRGAPHLNKTLYFWNEMIERKAPFVKIELLRTTHHRQDLRKVLALIERCSSYPSALIANHQRRIGGAACLYLGAETGPASYGPDSLANRS